jgi:hypothetical protein
METVTPITARMGARKSVLLYYAWVAMLVFSILPAILWNEVVGADGSWITPARLVILALLVGIGLFVPSLRLAWRFPVVLMVITVAGEIMARAAGSWTHLVAWMSPLIVQESFSVQLSKLGVSAAVLLALLALGFRRKEAFLTRGQMNAMAAPVRWLGFPEPEAWTSFGTKWLIFLSMGMIVILSVFGRPNLDALVGALRFIPIVLLLAFLNAFNEELVYRSSLLASTVGAIGDRQAHLLTAVLFGVSHYYGVPYGWGGMVLSTLMGWFLGKAMLETKGFGWPWLLHVVADVWIFYFILAGSIVPGG